MKYLILISLILGCGQEPPTSPDEPPLDKEKEIVLIPGPKGDTVVGPQGPKGDTVVGPQGEKGETGAPAPTPTPSPTPTNFEGYYSLPHGGYFEIVQRSDGSYIFYGEQRIYSVNFDSGLARHPSLPVGPHFILNNELIGTYSTNYSAANNDVEIDGDNTDITGNRQTYFKLFLLSGKLHIKIITYSNSGLLIEANREVIEE